MQRWIYKRILKKMTLFKTVPEVVIYAEPSNHSPFGSEII